MSRNLWLLGGAAIVVAAVAIAIAALWPRGAWTDEEVAAIRALSMGSLPALPPSPSNRYADSVEAAELGHRLFFDTRLSSNGMVSCATCHDPARQFQDGKPLADGVGRTNRRTMTVVGTAYSPWLFWDGRKDSLWAQALGPMENPVEHGGTRTLYAHQIAQHYRAEYEALFGPMPELDDLPANAGPVDDPVARSAWDAMAASDREAVTRIYVNMGKAIEAYERQIMPGAARFDAYAEGLVEGDRQAAAVLDADEVAGLRLFVGKASCTNCHNGPLFTNNDFHNTGVPAVAELPEDTGRALGATQVLADEFNCLSRYSDATPEQCSELRFLKPEGHVLERAFKPPSLRNVVGRGPFMHAGQIDTLQAVLAHYNTAPEAPAGHSELEPLNLDDTEVSQLIAFLGSLSGPLAAEERWLHPPAASAQ